MTKRPSRSVALFALMMLAACGGGDKTLTPVQHEARIAAARSVAQSFGKALLGELNAALETGGPVAAIGVCNAKAPALAAAAARDGYTVRRIGTRVRNRATNTPTAEERTILERFDQSPPDELAKASIESESGGRWALYLPILLAAPLCLQCHGPVEDIASEVRAKLTELYPDDEATGYAIGDLRGAFVVEAVQ